MISKRFKTTVLLFALFIATNSFSQWKEIQHEKHLKIEISRDQCPDYRDRIQNVYFFRFTNTSLQKRKFSWNLAIYRKNVCQNCDQIDSDEHFYEIILNPGESVEGKCSSDLYLHQHLYLFDTYEKYVKGMDMTPLSDFQFININTEVLP